MPNIYKRGKPDNGSVVHYLIKGNDIISSNTACYNGSYHIFYTYDKERVTCINCLQSRKMLNN